ncbi:redox-sensitive transcriptional activator SoxR [Rhodobacterales bacterium HKCCE2091]|nr:redox-sensitive transcriptional activator SoxR [Rhodobacterales bacterium HKCCE2091]
MALPADLSVGEVAERAGVAVSTLHFYEAEGLILSWRTPANHRRFDRRVLRRVAVIRAAQAAGVPLSEIREALSKLPSDARITKADWAGVAAAWADRLDAQIALLTRLRHQMDHCIGCGCLSLTACPLHNGDDRLGANGPGARRWFGGPDERAAPGG